MYRLLRDSEYDLVAQARQGEPARWRHLPWQVQPGEARWEREAGRPRQEEGEGQVLHHVGGSKQVHCMLAILFTFFIDLPTSFFSRMFTKDCDVGITFPDKVVTKGRRQS